MKHLVIFIHIKDKALTVYNTVNATMSILNWGKSFDMRAHVLEYIRYLD